jgi:very-short-patch-repair endonuclease
MRGLLPVPARRSSSVLTAKGYRVRSQVAVGYYRIDIVVYGSAGRVAIECDGDRYHPIEKIPDDMARQATLERLGWRFIRIRGSRFYRDPEGTMRAVEEQLQERGIEPLGASDGSVDEQRGDVAAAELQERLIRRAYELMRSWHPEETTPTALDGST